MLINDRRATLLCLLGCAYIVGTTQLAYSNITRLGHIWYLELQMGYLKTCSILSRLQPIHSHYVHTVDLTDVAYH